MRVKGVVVVAPTSVVSAIGLSGVSSLLRCEMVRSSCERSRSVDRESLASRRAQPLAVLVLLAAIALIGLPSLPRLAEDGEVAGPDR